MNVLHAGNVVLLVWRRRYCEFEAFKRRSIPWAYTMDGYIAWDIIQGSVDIEAFLRGLVERTQILITIPKL